MVLTIVADDLTGACDTGTLFAGHAPVPVTVWPAAPPAANVRVLDTESRAATGAEAAARVARVPALVPAARYFKKIDSTLRGHVALEVDALVRATGSASALVCPAFPAQGRVVVERVLLIDGTPVAETLLAGDPAFSVASSSSVAEVLRPHVNRPLAWIPLDQVRAGVERLAARLGRLSGTVTVADAENDSDLDALVEAAFASNREPLFVGAAGLARALAARLGLLADEVGLPAGARWLVVVGSRHPASP